MRVLLIGFGSIGKRHYEVLSSFCQIKTIDIVTKQTLENKRTFQSLEEVKNLKSYDYFVIASQTKKHFEQLKFLELHLKDKIIFCEKPLFERNKALKILKNRVYVGYVLRFHPLFEKLEKLIKNDTIININASCGQYLPTWRVDRDYRDSYSAKKEEGGGVLLDLSHEIDYVQHLCGKIEDVKSYQLKVSDLEIDSDDLTALIGRTTYGTVVNISIDYISKITHRKVHLDTINASYELDFIRNRLIQKNSSGEENIFENRALERNSMFQKMHQSILDAKTEASTYDEALEVMKTISTIQEQNR